MGPRMEEMGYSLDPRMRQEIFPGPRMEKGGILCPMDVGSGYSLNPGGMWGYSVGHWLEGRGIPWALTGGRGLT